MGAAISPFNSFLILQGIETLAVRMDRICENTLAVAEYLKGHAKVSWVNYAGLPDHREHALAQKYMGGRASGILSFGVKGGAAGGARFLDALKLIMRLVNIGDAKILACHPATTTHRQLVRRGTGEGRRVGRHGAAVDRHRAHRRHHGRPGTGAGGGVSAVSQRLTFAAQNKKAAPEFGAAFSISFPVPSL